MFGFNFILLIQGNRWLYAVHTPDHHHFPLDRRFHNSNNSYNDIYFSISAATSIRMPALSPTMQEGSIVKWYKKEGTFFINVDHNVSSFYQIFDLLIRINFVHR